MFAGVKPAGQECNWAQCYADGAASITWRQLFFRSRGLPVCLWKQEKSGRSCRSLCSDSWSRHVRTRHPGFWRPRRKFQQIREELTSPGQQNPPQRSGSSVFTLFKALPPHQDDFPFSPTKAFSVQTLICLRSKSHLYSTPLFALATNNFSKRGGGGFRLLSSIRPSILRPRRFILHACAFQ